MLRDRLKGVVSSVYELAGKRAPVHRICACFSLLTLVRLKVAERSSSKNKQKQAEAKINHHRTVGSNLQKFRQLCSSQLPEALAANSPSLPSR